MKMTDFVHAQKIKNIIKFKSEFCICTLVTNKIKYKEMLDTFINSGFTTDCTNYVYIDNLKSNNGDGYSGLNSFLSQSDGKYTIICHQDVRLNFDNKNDLISKIKEMDLYDPNWSVLGNAGGNNNFANLHIRITDPYGQNKNTSRFPVKVDSLDENFLIIKNGLNLGLSRDLKGFHFYGTDICLQAKLRGYNAYVIDFHLEHLSQGKADLNFKICKKQLIKKYQLAFKAKFIHTTCDYLFVSESKTLNFLANTRVFYKLKKIIDSLI